MSTFRPTNTHSAEFSYTRAFFVCTFFVLTLLGISELGSASPCEESSRRRLGLGWKNKFKTAFGNKSKGKGPFTSEFKLHGQKIRGTTGASIICSLGTSLLARMFHSGTHKELTYEFSYANFDKNDVILAKLSNGTCAILRRVIFIDNKLGEVNFVFERVNTYGGSPKDRRIFYLSENKICDITKGKHNVDHPLAKFLKELLSKFKQDRIVVQDTGSNFIVLDPSKTGEKFVQLEFPRNPLNALMQMEIGMNIEAGPREHVMSPSVHELPATRLNVATQMREHITKRYRRTRDLTKHTTSTTVSFITNKNSMKKHQKIAPHTSSE